MVIIINKLSIKENYLFQIKNAMLLHFSHKEIRATLDDLDTLFEAGKEDGRTEEETCQSLGTPKDFVDALLQEERRTRSAKILKTHIMAGLLLCVASAALYLERGVNLRPILLCVPVILIPAFAGYVCGGFCLYRSSWKRAGSLGKYSVYLVISLLAVIQEQAFAIQLYYDYEPLVPYVPATYYFASALIFLSIPICLAVFFEVDRGGCRSFPALILAIGTIGSSASYIRFIQRYIGPGSDWNVWYVCSLPYLLGVVIAIFYSRYMKKTLIKRKGNPMTWTHR